MAAGKMRTHHPLRLTPEGEVQRIADVAVGHHEAPHQRDVFAEPHIWRQPGRRQ